jgi:periplasmic protein TonB
MLNRLALFLKSLRKRRLFFEKPVQFASCHSSLVKILKPSHMKRKNEEVPEFDDIIFKDRNKEYGAYNLRKNYKSTVGLSILIGIGFAVVLVVLPALTAPTGEALPPSEITFAAPDPDLEKSLKVEPPPEKSRPAELIKRDRFIPPVVVNDTAEISRNILPTDLQFDKTTDGVPSEIPVDPGDIDQIIPQEIKPYIIVQEMPEYPGGVTALLKFVADNVVYPTEALINRVEGRITLRFVVTPSGTVDEIEVLSSVGTAEDLTLLEDEAKRVVHMLPKWRPGKQDGVAVPVYFTVPVAFKIND